jgi:hypothetical protein
MGIEDQYLDVLQNIEFGVVGFYRECPELSDYDVMRVLEALIDAYRAEKVGRSARNFNLSEREQDLLANVRHTCEWCLGREDLGDDPEKEEDLDPEPKTVDEIVLCLKRIRKSVERWNREGGRQGYLSFAAHYVK